MRVARGVVVFMAVMFFAATSMAAGFRLPEAGAKAMGMGFAFTAQANDPSAIYFNPAGITQLEGTNVMAGVTFIKENGGTFTGKTPLSGGSEITETQKDLDFFIPNAYVTRKASPTFAYGVGIFTPFGLGQEYKDRNASYFRNGVTKIELQSLVVNPTVAWKIDNVLSIGAGIDYMWGKATIARTGVVNNAITPVDNQLNLYNLDMEGTGDAWGYNFGILLTPSPNVKVGLSYRSSFTLEIKEADADVTNITGERLLFLPGMPPGTFPGIVSAGPPGGPTFSTKASTKLYLPATAALGIAYTRDRLTVEVDLDWTFWSRWQRLDIDIHQQGALLKDINSTRNWDDVLAYRIGGEYRVTEPLALRLGFAYDPTPVPTATMDSFLPDANRLNFMGGAGYKFGNWTIDGSYFYVAKKDRHVNNITANVPPGYGTGFNGTWKGDAHLLALDLGYRF